MVTGSIVGSMRNKIMCVTRCLWVWTAEQIKVIGVFCFFLNSLHRFAQEQLRPVVSHTVPCLSRLVFFFGFVLKLGGSLNEQLPLRHTPAPPPSMRKLHTHTLSSCEKAPPHHLSKERWSSKQWEPVAPPPPRHTWTPQQPQCCLNDSFSGKSKTLARSYCCTFPLLPAWD